MTETDNYRIYRLAFIALVIAAVYSTLVNHGFVWDDVDVIVNNPLFESFRNLPALFLTEDRIDTASGYYRPLTYLSFLVDRSIWGLNPLGFSITNVLLHIGTALALYLLVAELFKKEQLAFFTALLFALHPVANETVNFHAGGRNTLLCALFAFLALLFHARRRYGAAVACFALAMLSKEFALLIPAMFVFYDLRFSGEKPRFRCYAWYGIALVAYLLLRSYVVERPNFLAQFHFSNLLFLTPKLVTGYLANMINPLQLQIMYDIGPANRLWQVVPYLLVVAGIVAAVAVFRNKNEILFPAGWFFLFLLPVSGILSTGLTGMADRYVYFSSMGFALFLAFLISLAPKKAAAGIMLLLCVCYAGINYQRNCYWKDQMALFNRMVIDVPQMAIAYQNLGFLYYDKGDLDNSVKYLSSALGKNGTNSELMVNTASILWEAKQYDKAIYALKIKTAHDPYDPLGFLMLSKICGEKGDKAKEAFYHDKALQLSPEVDEMVRERIDALCRDIDVLLEKHELAGAERLLKEAQKIDPNALPVLVDSGSLAAEKGDLRKSLNYFAKALSLDPLYPQAHYNLSIVHQMMGNRAEAEKEMQLFRETEARATGNKRPPARK